MRIESLKSELHRKSFHLLILLLPLLFAICGKKIFLIGSIPISAAFIMLDFSRLKNQRLNQFWVKIFGKIMRESELNGSKLSGLSFTMLASCIIFPFAKPAIAICSFIILAISDSAAAIIGKSFPSKEFFEKSQNGSAAFFICSLLALLIVGQGFNQSFSFFFFGILACAFSTIAEARPSLFKIDDNFLIPASFAGFMSALDLIWAF